MIKLPRSAIGMPSEFTYIKEGSYTLPAWICTAEAGNFQSRAVETGYLFASPFYLPQSIEIDSVAFNQYIAGSGNVRIGIYEDLRFDRLPGKLLLDTGDVACSGSAGVRVITLGTTLKLRGDRIYWAAITFSVTESYLQSAAYSYLLGIHLPDDHVDYSPSPIGAVYKSHTYGALPDPFGTPTDYNSSWKGPVSGSETGLGVLLYMRVKPPGQTASAYILGGTTTTRCQTMEFSTEVCLLLSATLPYAHQQGAACNSSTRGYVCGNYDTWYPTGYIDRIIFATNVTAYTGVAISPHRMRNAACNSETVGYWAGGETGDDDSPRYAVVNIFNGFTFSTEAGKSISATLATARRLLAGVNSSSKGYFFGGNDLSGGQKNEIDGIQFSDETAINPSATLPAGRNSIATFNSTTRGYGAGGYISAVTADIFRFDFSDETINDISATLATARSGCCGAGANSDVRGYVFGGANGTYYAEIDGLAFETETAINPTAALYASTAYVSACQSGGYL